MAALKLFRRDERAPKGDNFGRLQAQTRLLSILTDAQAAFIAGQHVGDVIATVLSKIVELTGSSFALVSETESDRKGELPTEAAVSRDTPANSADPVRATLDQTLLEAKRTLFATELKLRASLRREAQPYQILDHFIALPLRSGGEDIGVIGLEVADVLDAGDIAEMLAPLQVTAASLLVAARDRASRARAEQRLQDAVESQSDAFALFDANDRLILHNSRFVELFPFMSVLGDLKGLPFIDMVTVPSGELSRTPDPKEYVRERMERHFAADGERFDIPMENNGWARVRERRTPEGGIVSVWSDISELKAAEQRLLDAISSIKEGFLLLGPDLTVTICNQRFRDMHVISGHLIKPGECLEDFLRHGAENGQFPEAAGRTEEFVERMLMAFRSEEHFRAEVLIGDDRWTLISNRRMANGGVVGIWTDLTDQKRREAELRSAQQRLEFKQSQLIELSGKLSSQARTDALTGLPNRTAFEEDLAAALGEVKAQGRTHILLYMDLDQFKVVNDTCGHAAGDKLLRELSGLLSRQLRPQDFVARLGGDEFGVILRDTSEQAAKHISERLCQTVRDFRFSIEEKAFAVGLSLGMLRIDAQTSDVSSALALADAACYAAKDAGRGRVHVYRIDNEEIIRGRDLMSWGQRIRDAIKEDRLQLWLQQIVDCDGVVRGHEALIRMLDENGTIRGPGTFLPAAKRLDLMIEIDKWVCGEAVKLIADSPQAEIGEDCPFVSINLSAKTIGDPIFRHWLIALIDQHHSVKTTLRIEITETDQLRWTSSEAALFEDLRKRGIKIYLDDFGSGYNSFDLIKKLKVDGIKIDWAVTKDMLDDPVDLALVKAAKSISTSLNIELVAEGVDSEAILQALRDLDIRLFQGHFFHVAEPACNVTGPATLDRRGPMQKRPTRIPAASNQASPSVSSC